MKISKIDNIRTGISIIEENLPDDKQKPYSTLYNSPARNASVQINLKSHVNDHIENTKRMYQVITPEIDYLKKNTIAYKYTNKLVKNFNQAIREILYKNNKINTDEGRVKRERSFLINFTEHNQREKYVIDISETDLKNIGKDKDAYVNDLITELVFRKIKKNLRRSVKIRQEKKQMTDIIILLMEAICLNWNCKKLDWTTVSAFFEVVDSDYHKSKQQKNIVKSIEEQSVKTQVVQENGKYLLQPANGNHKTKRYIFEFMRKYAGSDDNGKQELTEHMQKLIRLYIYGNEGYEKINDFISDITEDHACFDERIKIKLDTIEKNKELISENKKILREDKEKKENDPSKITEENRRLIEKKIENSKQIIMREGEDLQNLIETVMCDHYHYAEDYLVNTVKKTVLGEISGNNLTSGETQEKKTDRSADIFWLGYLDETVKKLLCRRKYESSPYRFEKGFLCNHLWKEWTQYIAGKYIDLGKGVYHFAVPDISMDSFETGISISEVRPEYRSGITGFDYERIKAEENLEREMARYVAYAISNFSRAVASDEERGKKGHEDVLIMKTESEIAKPGADYIRLYPDTDRRILQFFGGRSFYLNKGEDCQINRYSGEELYKAIRKELLFVRNMTFHYTTKVNQGQVNQEKITSTFFEEEVKDITYIFREKYYANNTWMFYSMEMLNDLMQKIYSGKKERAAQVPSFNKIISRPAISQILKDFIQKESMKILINKQEKVAEQYWSALYFILKELYYYDFLQIPDNNKDSVRTRFSEIINNHIGKEKNKKKKFAWISFKNRVNEIGDRSFGEICQGLMIDYTLQNKENKKVKTKIIGKKTDNKEKEIYKHYRTLLYICIREAFLWYLSEKWKELKSPELLKTELEKEEFCLSYDKTEIKMFDSLPDTFKETGISSSWYMAAHFMNPKYLNHLIGSIRNYMQFTEDIERRAGLLNVRMSEKYEEKLQEYRKILEILEFVALFCGRTTNKLEDYMESSRQYAEYLSRFVDYRTTKETPDIEKALYAFCNRKIKVGSEKCSVGIYCDGKNLIPNRNIIHANMYGNTACLGNVEKITIDEIRNYYNMKLELDSVLKEGVCRSKEDQEKLRKYQNAKNRIELLDLEIYTEILNDLQSELVNWSYIRERDLMYYQLGYYYTKLNWTESISLENERNRLIGEKVKIENGAILYQILAINSYNLPVISNIKDKIKLMINNGSIGGKAIRDFFNNFMNAGLYYKDGLSLFEYIDEHREIINTRNYIDHFKYFSTKDRSMLELYSEVYDRFFRHDYKLKKGVTVVLSNVLSRYFMDLKLEMLLRNKIVEKKEHRATEIAIKEIKSTALTYRIVPDEKKSNVKEDILVKARSEIFINQMMNILKSSNGKTE